MDYQNTFFHRDFYPTPKSVIDIMMADEDVSDKIVLEPSAGKGDIVKWLIGNGARCVLACEINDTLRKTLTDCDVIGTDFLQMTKEQVSCVDYIVMNPPFLCGMDHLHHAYEIAPGGCTIVCVLPHSRFDSSHFTSLRRFKAKKLGLKQEEGEQWREYQKRLEKATLTEEQIAEYKQIHERETAINMRNAKLLDNIMLNGRHENIGPVFAETDAERRHEYDIELIKIYKPKSDEKEFEDYLFDLNDADEHCDGMSQGLMPHNKVYELVSRYIDAVKQFDAVERMSKRINESASDFSQFRIRFGAHGKDTEGNSLGNITRERYKKELQKAAWMKVISLFNMEKYATSSLRSQINKFVETQTHVPFTMKNIYKMADMIIQTNGQRMEQSIIEAFELVCKFAPENIDLKDGKANNRDAWKTNSDYMVNKRFIIPYMATEYQKWDRAEMKTYGGNYDEVNDLMKALNYICGLEKGDAVNNLSRLFNDTKTEWGKWCEFPWFRIRLYKKGTMHFEFTGDLGERIWMKFNQTYAKHKGWRIGQTTTAAKKGGGKKKETADSEPAEPIVMPNIISETYENGRFEIVIEAA